MQRSWLSQKRRLTSQERLDAGGDRPIRSLRTAILAGRQIFLAGRRRLSPPGVLLAGLLWATAKPQPLLQKLDGPTRAKVLATLAGLIILGMAMIFLTWLGARAVRRYTGQSSFEPRTNPDPDAWAHKPLVEPLDDSDMPDSADH